MISKDDLKQIIDMCFDAVNESKIGPVWKINKDGQGGIDQITYNTFLYIVSSICPKNLTTDINMKDHGENWKDNSGNV